ncbi:hypothetical protein [uncultured Roseibium sp.]|uniref:hypothetical protein n=1 Tax=uncultured Roseibium sp. TaxID=1936171 RepID=UPI0026395574|nr:hypothetical protein [uncultured Roseibium sp.]
MKTEYDAHIEAATLALQIARQQITDEIKNYPTPVAGCDLQYNVLLSKRMQVTRALHAMSSEVFVPTPRTLVAGGGVESR